MNETASLAVTNESLSIIELIIHASLLVQIVLLILVAASLASWTLIFTKASTFKKLREEVDRFENDFWSGGDLNALFKDLSSQTEDEAIGMAKLFIKGYVKAKIIELIPSTIFKKLNCKRITKAIRQRKNTYTSAL